MMGARYNVLLATLEPEGGSFSSKVNISKLIFTDTSDHQLSNISEVTNITDCHLATWPGDSQVQCV